MQVLLEGMKWALSKHTHTQPLPYYKITMYIGESFGSKWTLFNVLIKCSLTHCLHTCRWRLNKHVLFLSCSFFFFSLSHFAHLILRQSLGLFTENKNCFFIFFISFIKGYFEIECVCVCVLLLIWDVDCIVSTTLVSTKQLIIHCSSSCA